MQYIIYYPLYKLLKKYLSIKVWQILQKELQIWNATLITGVTCFNIEIIKKEIWEVKKKNVTTLKMETFSAYEHEIPILSSYTERKEEVKGKSPLITAQIYKSFPEHLYSKTIKWCSQRCPWFWGHFKAIKLTLLHSS